jgi:hypothetical protein
MNTKTKLSHKIIIGMLMMLILVISIPVYLLLTWKPRPSAGSTEALTHDNKVVMLELTHQEIIRGGNTQMYVLSVSGDDRNGSRISSGKGYYPNDADRNILFLVGDEKTPHWLFPQHGQRILSANQLPDEKINKDSPTQVLYFEFSNQNPNDATEGNQKNKRSIALTKPNGEKPTVVLENISRIMSTEIVQGSVSIVYQVEKSLRLARFNLDTFERLSDREITVMPDRLN